jgi:hypothetical protein
MDWRNDPYFDVQMAIYELLPSARRQFDFIDLLIVDLADTRVALQVFLLTDRIEGFEEVGFKNYVKSEILRLTKRRIELIEVERKIGKPALKKSSKPPVPQLPVDLICERTMQAFLAARLHKVFIFSEGCLAVVFLFFKTNREVLACTDSGVVEQMKEFVVGEIHAVVGPGAGELKVSFEVDSHENVVKNWGGSYYARVH